MTWMSLLQNVHRAAVRIDSHLSGKVKILRDIQQRRVLFLSNKAHFILRIWATS